MLRPDGSPMSPVPPPDHRHRLDPEALEAQQSEDRHQVPDMERVEGRVEPVVGSQWRAGRESCLEALGRRVERAPASAARRAGPAHRALARSRRHTVAREARRTRPGGPEGNSCPYAIVTDDMQTSLARRQRRRRNGSGRPPTGGSNVRRIAIAIPLLLFAALVMLGVLGFVTVVAGVHLLRQGPARPEGRSSRTSTFDQETRIYDRTGKIQLAAFAREKRDVVTFEQIPPELVDATTAVEDQTFWENAGFDPAGIVSAGIDTLQGRGRGASTITQQLVRNRLLPDWALRGDAPTTARSARSSSRSA